MSTLNNYTFLPWTRQGIAAEISAADNLGNAGAGPVTERAEVAVRFTVNGEPVSKHVQILGPGDVVGISPRAIVKTDPRHGVTDFESNYLAYIEFYEEDFPWRFTPVTAANSLAQSRLRPWIFLVVLKEDEFMERKTSGPLSAFAIRDELDPAAFFPPAEQSWAWAHVHVSRNIIGTILQTTTEQDVRTVEQNLQQTLRINADSASSRLICPRKLDDNTAYYAFVVPAFETGRLAGAGLDIPAGSSGQLASWGAGQRLYPIYYRWFFRTGEKGDFEFLVDLLEPRAVDERVGIRAMDMQEPGYEVDGMTGPLRDVGLEGALKSPETESFPPQWPPAGTDFENAPPGSPGNFLNQLEETINLQFQLLQEESSANPHPDPIVSPPLYGKWYAMAERLDVEEPGWVNELNGDPRYRAPAGAGTEVIQKEQEKFMQQAWAQLGDLLRANQKIRQLQMAWMSAFASYRKNVLPQSTDQLLTFTHAVQTRVLGSTATIARQVRDSRVPRAALEPAFRKITRPRGAILRKAVPDGAPRPATVLGELNEGKLSAAPPAPFPTGQLSLNADETAKVFPGLDFKPDNVDQIKPRPDFVLTEFDVPLPRQDDGGGDDSKEAKNFRIALKDAFNVYESPPPPVSVRPSLDLGNAVLRLKESLNPAVAIPRRAEYVLKIPESVKGLYLGPRRTLVPVMAHPVFTEPMYRALRDISADFLAPNLHLIPNNTISLMETNQRFIEAYMVGLNHEMGRELLWRQFPTDQRGSYFRQFWDVGDTVTRDPNTPAAQVEEELLDITRLHTWDRETSLGDHANRPLPTGAEPGEARLVLVVRGDLLRKYPTAVIYAQRARWSQDAQGRDIRELDDSQPAQFIKPPIFKAEIEPDLRFLGFDLTASVVKGDSDPAAANPGWFFVIQERPGEPRFGLDYLNEDSPASPTNWNELAWEHLDDFPTLRCVDVGVNTPPAGAVITDGQFAWGRNAADMAYILYQVPVMVAFHAADMLS